MSGWAGLVGHPGGLPVEPADRWIGAFFLRRLDEQMTRLGLFYVRFMDDILVLAPTRWKLRKAVAVVNRGLGALGRFPGFRTTRIYWTN